MKRKTDTRVQKAESKILGAGLQGISSIRDIFKTGELKVLDCPYLN